MIRYQRSVLESICDGIGVCAHGMGNLHICEGTIDAERYIQVLEQHVVASKQRLQEHPAYFSKTILSHKLLVFQQRGFVVRVLMILSTIFTTLSTHFQSEALQAPDRTEMQLVSMLPIVCL
ncbi:hypothetical protein ATANTOWER_022227 [Ataeniobius toweri]|uniref:Uncharacterized protein n=1 Tax=Ataeniobius toweri TaxID=208326 RepID=A0ABU7AGX7_9TELE|nr:hypothetical protein [Ataeniobius toweri]